MALKYFPDRPQKKFKPAIDRIIERRNPISVTTYGNCQSADTTLEVSNDDDWKVDSTAINFSNNTVSKTYTVAIKNGRRVVNDINDALWFWGSGTMPQSITLSPGFYDGTDLASELQTQLNANNSFATTLLTPFVVSYAANVGTFTITANAAGTFKYVDVNQQATLPNYQSVGGHLFGLETTGSAFTNSVVSDVNVYGLNMVTNLLSGSAVTTQNIYDEEHILTEDQALLVTVNQVASPLEVNISVSHELLV